MPGKFELPTNGVAIYKSENRAAKLARLGLTAGKFHSWMECTGALCYASTTRGLTKPAWGYMQPSSTHEVTGLLRAWSGGDQEALQKLTPLVYQQLHRIAQRYMAAERSDHTLQATALIHEAYLRLVDVGEINWQDRAHFFAMCAQLMRHILTDFARSRRFQKRGGDAVHVPLDEGLVVSREPDRDLVAVDDALSALAAVDERKSRVVELRFFGGLSVDETAEVLKVSPDTVMRDWKLAKVWLLGQLNEEQRYGA